MFEIVDITDAQAERNKDNLVAFYRRAINDKQPREAAAALGKMDADGVALEHWDVLIWTFPPRDVTRARTAHSPKCPYA